MVNLRVYKFAVLIAVGVCLRSTISLHSYSGQDAPPMFGDFEAQRHWQEVTVNLPMKDWYENTTDNDLLYWGLDYPPLTAYHSLVIGEIAKRVNKSYVELHESRGISTESHKNFMRLTVIVADVLIYIPALVIACKVIFERIFKFNPAKSQKFFFVFLSVALFYPGQILIDNGHFQYNNVSLGLAVLAVVGILVNRRILAAIFFVLALNYKQMELYHALPFFCYLLANCFFDPDSHKK
jgi:alpha-1,3-glucosyltransferase